MPPEVSAANEAIGAVEATAKEMKALRDTVNGRADKKATPEETQRFEELRDGLPDQETAAQTAVDAIQDSAAKAAAQISLNMAKALAPFGLPNMLPEFIENAENAVAAVVSTAIAMKALHDKVDGRSDKKATDAEKKEFEDLQTLLGTQETAAQKALDSLISSVPKEQLEQRLHDAKEWTPEALTVSSGEQAVEANEAISEVTGSVSELNAFEAIDSHEVAANSIDRSLDGKEERSGASRPAHEKSEVPAHQGATEVLETFADGAGAPQGAARASERPEAADARETAPDQGQEGGKPAETSADGAVQPAPEAGEQSEALNPAHVELAGNPELAAAPAPMFLGSGYDFGSLNLSTESLAPSNAGDEGLWAPGSGLGVVDFAAGADEPAPTIGANVINLGGKEDARLPGEADDDKPQSSEAHYEYGSDGSLSDSAGASPLDQNGHHGIL